MLVFFFFVHVLCVCWFLHSRSFVLLHSICKRKKTMRRLLRRGPCSTQRLPFGLQQGFKMDLDTNVCFDAVTGEVKHPQRNEPCYNLANKAQLRSVVSCARRSPTHGHAEGVDNTPWDGMMNRVNWKACPDKERYVDEEEMDDCVNDGDQSPENKEQIDRSVKTSCEIDAVAQGEFSVAKLHVHLQTATRT